MILIRLSKFISSERNRFDTRHDNMFAFSFSQVARYYEFLLIIAKRYEQSGKLFTKNFKEFQATINKRPGSHRMTQRQMQIQEEGRGITLKLHLEIESFYLFAKILLDKFSRALEFYFGQARGLSLDSHNLLYKNLAKFSSDKGLKYDKGLLELIKKLKEEISDFRDYQIAHHKNPRTTQGTMFSPTGETRMLLYSIYPKPEDKQVESKAIQELLALLDSYTGKVINFLRKNQEKTNLKLKS